MNQFLDFDGAEILFLLDFSVYILVFQKVDIVYFYVKFTPSTFFCQVFTAKILRISLVLIQYFNFSAKLS